MREKNIVLQSVTDNDVLQSVADNDVQIGDEG